MNSEIVIVDDKINEVEPLILYFSKKSIPVSYFTGNDLELPQEPIYNLRYIFLDLHIDDNNTHTDKNLFSRCMGILDKLIPEDQKYTLVIWSKHFEKFDDNDGPLSKKSFIDALESLKKKPVDIVLTKDKLNFFDKNNKIIPCGDFSEEFIKKLENIGKETKYKLIRSEVIERAIDLELEIQEIIEKRFKNHNLHHFFPSSEINKPEFSFTKKLNIVKKSLPFIGINSGKIYDSMNKFQKDIISVRNIFAHKKTTKSGEIIIGKDNIDIIKDFNSIRNKFKEHNNNLLNLKSKY